MSQPRARRGWQRGALRSQGARWIVRYRTAEVDSAGVRIRRERHAIVGLKRDMGQAEARRAADLLVDRLLGREQLPQSRIGATQWLEHYGHQYLPLLKPASRASFSSIIRRHLAPALRGRRLDEIGQRSAQQLIGELAQQRLAVKTIRNVVAILARTLAVARSEGYATGTLETRRLVYPASTAVAEDLKLYSAAELATMIEAAPMPWQVLLALCAYLGLRIAEALGMRWQDLDRERRIVKVRQAAVFGRAQSLKSRTSRADLPMADELAAILERYRAEWTPNQNDLLFATGSGRPVWSSHVRRSVLRPLCERLGIAWRGVHAIRHSTASHLLANGASAAVTRDLLRHGSLQVTNRYSHSLPTERRTASNALAALLSPKATADA